MSWVERHIGLVLLVVLVVLAVGGYSLLWWLTKEDFDMRGSARSRGLPTGDFVIEAGTCDVTRKHAVESITESGTIEVFRRGDELVVRVEPASSGSLIELTRGTCQVFDATLEDTGNTYNKADVWRGHVKASCQRGAATIEVALQFGKCV